jgi:hypothetical protein
MKNRKDDVDNIYTHKNCVDIFYSAPFFLEWLLGMAPYEEVAEAEFS